MANPQLPEDVSVSTYETLQDWINKKIRKSTDNISKGPAMSYEEAVKGILIGIDAVKKAKDEGYEILGVGEMGIGNTSTSSAVLSALTGVSVEEVVGRGAGITNEAFIKKIGVVKQALKINKPNKKDPIDVVSKVGKMSITLPVTFLTLSK